MMTTVFAINDFWEHGCKRDGGRAHSLREVDAIALCLCGNGIVAPSAGAAELGWEPQINDANMKKLSEVLRYARLPSTAPAESDRLAMQVANVCKPMQRNSWVLARNEAAKKGWDFLFHSGIRERVQSLPPGTPQLPFVRVDSKQTWYFKGEEIKAGEVRSVESRDAVLPCFAQWMRLVDPADLPKIEAVASDWHRVLSGRARLTGPAHA